MKLTTVEFENEIREFLLVVKGYFLGVVMGAKIVVGVNIVGLYLNNHLPFLEGYFFPTRTGWLCRGRARYGAGGSTMAPRKGPKSKVQTLSCRIVNPLHGSC